MPQTIVHEGLRHSSVAAAVGRQGQRAGQDTEGAEIQRPCRAWLVDSSDTRHGINLRTRQAAQSRVLSKGCMPTVTPQEGLSWNVR